MKSAAKPRPDFTPYNEPIAVGNAEDLGRGPTIEVRLPNGDIAQELELYPDGMSFMLHRPLPGGRRIELEVCRAIRLETIVVGCVRVPGEKDLFMVRARYHNSSATLNSLIYEELRAMLNRSR